MSSRLTPPGEPDPSSHPLLAKGLEEFRAGRFFEAHEEWEALWTKSEGDEKVFLQALIQIAAACVHLTRGNGKPGIRLLKLAEDKLARLPGEFGEFREFEKDSLRKEIGRAAERIGRGEAPREVAKDFRI